MEEARSLKTMEAPRQKLINERATVVATTTLGLVIAAAIRPFCEDICKLYSRASARGPFKAKGAITFPRGDVPQGNRANQPRESSPLPDRSRRRRGRTPPRAPQESITRRRRAGHHPAAALQIPDLPCRNILVPSPKC